MIAGLKRALRPARSKITGAARREATRCDGDGEDDGVARCGATTAEEIVRVTPPSLPDADPRVDGGAHWVGVGLTGKRLPPTLRGDPRGGGEKARVSSPDTPTVGFSKRTALNGHERVFRSSVPAHAYIYYT